MKKNEIIDMVGRQFSVENAKKELITLKTLLNTTQCKISQYNIELKAVEQEIESQRTVLDSKMKEAQDSARERFERAKESCNDEKAELKKKYRDERAAKDFEIKKNNYHISVTEYELAELKRNPNSNAVSENDNVKKSELSTKITMLYQKDSLLQCEANELFEAYEQAESKVCEKELDIENKFFEETRIFERLDSSTNLNDLVYYSQLDLAYIAFLKERVSKLREKKSEITMGLEQSSSEKTTTIGRIQLLESKIESALNDRAYLRGKVVSTTEALGRQAKEAFTMVKTAVDSKINDSTQTTSEQSDTTETLDFESIIKGLAEGIVEDYANQGSKVFPKETLNTIFKVFGKK